MFKAEELQKYNYHFQVFAKTEQFAAVLSANECFDPFDVVIIGSEMHYLNFFKHYAWNIILKKHRLVRYTYKKYR